MEKRQLLLLGSFVAFYYLIHMVYDMPNLVHGSPGYDWFPGSLWRWMERIGDIGFFFLLTYISYWTLWRWWPSRKMMPMAAMLLVGLPLIFLIRYWLERKGVGRGERLRSFFLNNQFYTLIFIVLGVDLYFNRWSRYKELKQKELK